MDLFDDEIIEIVECEDEETIDIEVSEISNNLFFANDILTHNSAFDSSDITLSNIAESAGLIHTVDALFAITRPPNDRQDIGTYLCKALALRNADGQGNKQTFTCDFNYMKLTEDQENNISRPDVFDL